MSNYWPKARASRPNVYQTTLLTTSLSGVSNLLSKFSGETYQIRAQANAPAWLSVGDSSGVSAAIGTGVPIAANVVGEAFAVTPGQWAAFISTSTSTTSYFSLIEMA